MSARFVDKVPARSVAAFVVALVLAAGCAEEVVVAQRSAHRLPSAGGPQPWSAKACDPGKLTPDVLACVGGVPVTRAAFDRVVGAYPPGTSPAAIVQALVDAEVLAQKARTSGLWSDWLLDEHKRAMVRGYLERHFEDNYKAANVAEADMRRAWRDWRIRIRYVREPSYFATDAQFLCCSGDWRKCEIRRDVNKCIDGLSDQAHELAKILQADPPRSALEMKGRVYALGHRFPKVAIADVNFFYIKDIPHEDQIGKGYEVMVEPYAKAVTAMKPGDISPPIRTPFGWHIARLNSYEPPKAGKLTDPTIRNDIADNILPLVRKRDVQRRAYELMSKRKVKITFDEALKKS